MSLPMFFINKISGSNASNKAQEFVDNEIRAFEYRTIQDTAGLDELEKHLQDILTEAHTKFPRCKVMTLSKGRYILGGYEFCVHASSTGYNIVTSLIVIEIKGDWKGGLK